MKKIVLILFIFITHTSSFMSLMIYNLTNNPRSSSITAFNDLTLFFLGLLSLVNLNIKYYKLNYLIISILLLLLLIVNLLIWSNADFFFRLLAFRKLVAILVSFFIGYNLFEYGFPIDKYLKYHCLIFIPIAFFGFIEYFLPLSFWDHTLKLPQFWEEKGELFTKHSVATSGKFISYDLYPIIGRKTRRIVSFYTETKPLSSYCIFLFPFVYFVKTFYLRKMILPLILIVGILTYSKGFILIVLLCWSAKIIHLRPSYIYIVFLVFFMLGVLVHRLGIGFGPLSHVEGLYTGFQILFSGELFGVGLGATGNYTSQLVESLGGGESGLGALVGQIGIGALVFFFIVYFLMNKVYKLSVSLNDCIYYAMFVCIFGWMINFFYSEASLGFRGNIFVFFSAGMIINNSSKAFRGEKES